jgi:hypothetical protein
MNAGASEGSWTIRLSIRIYRRLLVAYPDAFRREYGAHMAQVFGDCRRETAQADGVVGLWRYWLTAFGDLIGSALAERRRQEFRMSRTVWARLGSLAAIGSGTTAALFALFGLLKGGAYLLDQMSPLARDSIPVQVKVWEVTPVVSALYLLALVGLSLQGARRAGALGWIGATMSMIGTALIAASNGYYSALIYAQADGCVSSINCAFYFPQPYEQAAELAQAIGVLLFAVGMILYGVASLRQQVLSRWNGAPLLIGLLALCSPASRIIFALFFSAGSDYFGIMRVSVALAAVELLLAGAWIALGVALYPRNEERAASQAIPANSLVE